LVVVVWVDRPVTGQWWAGVILHRRPMFQGSPVRDFNASTLPLLGAHCWVTAERFQCAGGESPEREASSSLVVPPAPPSPPPSPESRAQALVLRWAGWPTHRHAHEVGRAWMVVEAGDAGGEMSTDVSGGLRRRWWRPEQTLVLA